MNRKIASTQTVENNFFENISLSPKVKRLPLKEKLNDKIFTKMVNCSMSIEKQKLINARMNRKTMKYVKNKVKNLKNRKVNNYEQLFSQLIL